MTSASRTAAVFVPATIGNVGPGFDVLGLAVEGLGDEVTVQLTDGPSSVASVTGRDAHLVPTDPKGNCAIAAAESLLRLSGSRQNVILSLKRGLPIAGGLGSSAAASVGGAYAAALALGAGIRSEDLLAAALDGESLVAGRHLDNIAPAFFGGLCLVLGTEPPKVATAPITGEWWVALVSPAMQLATKTARALLPEQVERATFVKQMGYTAGLLAAFAKGDHALARASLIDLFAEPRRAPLIERFAAVKSSALQAGALGCSISGAGPTLFALCDREATASRAADAMASAFHPTAAAIHVGRVATEGARPL